MFEIIALVAVALGVWGLVSAGFRIGLRRKPPRYLVPLVVGSAMLGFAVWNDYSWQDRTAEALPPQAVIVERFTKRVGWQPWTLLVPRVDALLVIDRERIRRNDRLPDFPMAEVALIGRYAKTLVATHLVDCAKSRHTVVGQKTELDDQGLPKNAVWETLAPESTIIAAVCTP